MSQSQESQSNANLNQSRNNYTQNDNQQPSQKFNNLDNVQLNEHIKEYLKWNGFQNTFECFEAEINAQRTSTKLQNQKIINPLNQKDAPRLYSYVQNENLKSEREKELNDNFKIVQQKYLQLLTGARHLFAVAVNLVNDYQQTQEGQNPDLQDQILTYQRSILQYRKLILYESDSPTSDSLTNNQVKEMKQKILNLYKEGKKNELLNQFVKLRSSALQCKYDQRQQFGAVIIEEDIICLKDDENGINQSNKEENYIYSILNGFDFHLKKAALTIVSIYVAFQQGQHNLINLDKDYLLLEIIIQILKNQDQGSVGQRFCLAILYKMSQLKDVKQYYYNKDIQTLMANIIKNSQQLKTHAFCSEYASAILGNIIGDKNIILYYQEQPKKSLQFIQELLQLPSPDFQLNTNKNLLYTISQFKGTDKFNTQILESGYDDKINSFLTAIERSQKTIYEKQEILRWHQQVFRIKESQNQSQQEEAKQELRDVIDYQTDTLQQFILFEHFRDEVETTYGIEDSDKTAKINEK